LALLPSSAWALSANELLADCEPAMRMVEAQGALQGVGFSTGLCLGYASAAADFLRFRNDVCIPYGATVGQLIRVFVHYAQGHPQDLRGTAYSEMLLVVREASGGPFSLAAGLGFGPYGIDAKLFDWLT
jgi:hypothetical protein